MILKQTFKLKKKMSNKKKILFVTSTRADFGKLKSLIKITKSYNQFEVLVVVTGMHMLKKFGNTYREVTKSFKSKFPEKFNSAELICKSVPNWLLILFAIFFARKVCTLELFTVKKKPITIVINTKIKNLYFFK